MNTLKKEDVFIEELVLAFPEIEEEVRDEDYKGLIGLQISCLRRFTQSAINTNNIDAVVRSFEFVKDSIGKVEHKVENALYIAYVGKLLIEKNSKVESLLPANLKSTYEDLNEYYNSASKTKN